MLDLPKENDMTQEEIIDVARQAGFERLGHDEHDYVCYPDDIVAFAKLIADHERKNFCAQLAQLHDSYSLASHTTTLRGQE